MKIRSISFIKFYLKIYLILQLKYNQFIILTICQFTNLLKI